MIINQRSFSFFSLFLGLFLVIIGTLSTSRTRPFWYSSITVLILDIIVFLISLERRFHISILGIVLAVAIVYLLFRNRENFSEPSSIITDPRLAVSFIIVAFTAAYGIGGSILLGQQFSPPITSLGNALYYNGKTVTTLGFGDILPITLTARLFTVSLSVMGLAVFFGSLTLLLTPVIEKRIGGVSLTMEKMGMKSLRNYILICGYSPIVYSYMKSIRDKGKTVAVIENDESTFKTLTEAGFLLIKGDPDDEKLLELFQLSFSDGIVVGTSSDSRNLLICAAISQTIHDDETRKKVKVIINAPRNRNKFSSLGFHIIDISSLVGEILLRE